MAGTFNIPLTTLPPGVHNFPASGGAAIADSDSLAVLTIDRTVPGGLNVRPGTGRLARAQVTVTGTAVAVAGTLTVS